MKINRSSISISLIVLFHAVGLAGFLSPYSNLFLKLVPFHLLLMAVLLVFSHPDKNKDFWIFIATFYISGFIVEMLGTNTGMIFGKYVYGKTLGLKLAETPLIIGVNWIILIYSVGITMRGFRIRSRLKKALLGALLLVLLDILIEPVAIRSDYWKWTELEIPFQNYVAWFIFSFLLLCFFYRFNFKKRNPAALAMIVTQFIFFIILNLTAV